MVIFATLTNFCMSLTIDEGPETGSAGRSQLAQHRSRPEEQYLLDLIGLLVDERDVATGKNLARPLNVAGKAVSGAGGHHGIIEARGDEVRHSNTLNRVGVLIAFARV